MCVIINKKSQPPKYKFLLLSSRCLSESDSALSRLLLLLSCALCFLSIDVSNTEDFNFSFGHGALNGF